MDHLDFHLDTERPPSYRTADHSQNSDSDVSPPRTPPSPVLATQPAIVPVVEPQVTPPNNGSVKRSPNRATPSKSRLGAIDEHSDAMSPDLPQRSPLRRLGFNHTKLFGLGASGNTKSGRNGEPKQIWDDIEGPNGEKFADVRQNSKRPPTGGAAGTAAATQPKKSRKRRFICIGLILLGIGLIVMIVLLAVLLTRRDRNGNNNNSSNGGNSNSGNPSLPADQSFPAGNYTIATYITTIATSCVSNPRTWRCPPGNQTYSQTGGSSSSSTNFLWTITNTGPSSSSFGQNVYTISSNPTSGYQFSDRILTLRNNGTAEEAYVVTLTFQKSVYPLDITGDNAASRCYFNNTVLTATLYTKKAKPENQVLDSTGGGANQWPYAMDFGDQIQGSIAPECYRYNNGANGDRIQGITAPSNSSSNAECQCQYSNYNF